MMDAKRRATFVTALKPVWHECDAVLDEPTSSRSWAEMLPARTLIVHAQDTTRPVREMVGLMQGGTS